MVNDKAYRMSMNTTLFFFCMCLMIITTIFNGNKYVAGLSFVWFPSILLLGSSLIVKKYNLLNKLNVLAVLLAVSAAIATYTADVPLAHSTYINLIFCILSYCVISSVKLSDQVFRLIICFFVNFGFVVCCILIFNTIFGFSIQQFSAGNTRVTIEYFGISKDVNYLSSFVTPAFAYFFYLGTIGKNKVALTKCGIIFVALFLAGSRACFLAMFFSAIIIITKLLRDKEHHINKAVYILGLGILSILLLGIISTSEIFARTMNFSNYGNNSRLTIWEHALEGFWAKPIFGSGVESGSYYSLQYTRWKTHSCFVDILTGQGIVGSFIIVLMFKRYIFVKKSNRAIMWSILVCFFLPLFFVNGYECATFWMPMTICRYFMAKCNEHEDILPILL